MKFKINSIKNRILTAFLSVLFGVFVLGLVSLYYLNRINQVRELDNLLSRIESQSLHLIKVDNDFYDIEAINESYFIHKESRLLDKRHLLWREINEKIREAKSHQGMSTMVNELTKVEVTLALYNERFLVLTEKIYQRGFKDHGLEGKMRNYAHRLENFTEEIELSDILSLRRHEKDFFLRNDTAYITQLNVRAQAIYTYLLKKGGSDSSKLLIRMYTDTFNELALIEKEIGLNSNEGLRHELNTLTRLLDNHFDLLSDKSEEWSRSLTQRILLLFSSVLVLTILVISIWGNFVANKLSRPVKKLDAIMRNAAQRDLKGLIEVPLQNPSSEMENLSRSFLALMKKTKLQMKEIKDKSKTLRKQNAELKKLNNELDSFIYSTAHDLRSPLASLLGLVNLAEREDTPYEKKEYISLMKLSIQKMDTFIRDVVAYSKNKKLDIVKAQFNIKELVESIFQEHRFMPNAESIDKKLVIRGPELVSNDEGRLKIIFNNLISNAIRYADMEKPVPAISIQIEVTPTQVNIVFSDNGIGIEPGYIDQIFQMFFRATENSPGSGLGLFILQETVKRLGGTVEASSEVGVGTSFYVSLPNDLPESARNLTYQTKVFS